MIGLVTFQTNLKPDARQTINKLTESHIQTKVITGDNIFIAIQTAHRAGILQRTARGNRVVLVEGNRQEAGHQQQMRARVKARMLYFQDSQRGQNQLKLDRQQDLVLQSNDGGFDQTWPIAVDNDFLKLYPHLLRISSIKVFARITPQNKALIVRKLKSQIN